MTSGSYVWWGVSQKPGRLTEPHHVAFPASEEQGVAGSLRAGCAAAQSSSIAGSGAWGTCSLSALHPGTPAVLLQFVFRNQFLHMEMCGDPSFQSLVLRGHVNSTRKQRQWENHAEEQPHTPRAVAGPRRGATAGFTLG